MVSQIHKLSVKKKKKTKKSFWCEKAKKPLNTNQEKPAKRLLNIYLYEY